MVNFLFTKQKAFTLLELLLVLVIVGLASSLIIPRLNSDVKLHKAQVRELAAILKYSRRMAVVTNRIHQTVLFPAINKEQAITPDSNTNNNNKKNKKNKGHWHSRGADYTWYPSKSKNKIINKKVSIDFFPQGGATAGTIEIKMNKLETKIIVDGFTGKVTIKNNETQ